MPGFNGRSCRARPATRIWRPLLAADQRLGSNSSRSGGTMSLKPGRVAVVLQVMFILARPWMSMLRAYRRLASACPAVDAPGCRTWRRETVRAAGTANDSIPVETLVVGTHRGQKPRPADIVFNAFPSRPAAYSEPPVPPRVPPAGEDRSGETESEHHHSHHHGGARCPPVARTGIEHCTRSRQPAWVHGPGEGARVRQVGHNDRCRGIKSARETHRCSTPPASCP